MELYFTPGRSSVPVFKSDIRKPLNLKFRESDETLVNRDLPTTKKLKNGTIVEINEKEALERALNRFYNFLKINFSQYHLDYNLNTKNILAACFGFKHGALGKNGSISKLAFNLSKNEKHYFFSCLKNRYVTKSSIDMAVTLYVLTKGVNIAFKNSIFDAKGFESFLSINLKQLKIEKIDTSYYSANNIKMIISQNNEVLITCNHYTFEAPLKNLFLSMIYEDNDDTDTDDTDRERYTLGPNSNVYNKKFDSINNSCYF